MAGLSVLSLCKTLILCLVWVKSRKTCPDMTEKLLTEKNKIKQSSCSVGICIYTEPNAKSDRKLNIPNIFHPL